MSGTSQSRIKIPVVIEGRSSTPYKGLRWKNRAARYGVIILAILIPLSGLFRIDVSSGFIILSRQVWFSDFFLVFGLWLALVSLIIMFYSTLGTAFCGWVCPQNTLSSWADSVTQKLLGKRAVVDWEKSAGGKVAAAKNRWGNWLLLVLKLVAASMLIALIPLLYFNTPGAMWSFVTFQANDQLAGSLHWIYLVFVFIIFVNIAVVRHFMCRYMCFYRMWQFLFKTRDTLHVEYDESRADECRKCNYCVTSCMVGIDPRKTQTYDSCTNCGECLSACASLQAKSGKSGLLSFKFGPRRSERLQVAEQTKLASISSRLKWVSPVFLLGTALFVWGLWSYQPYHFTVYRAEMQQRGQIDNYRINIANKIYHPVNFTIDIEGIDKALYEIDTTSINLSSAGRSDALLHIKEGLPGGVHTFTVRVSSDDGWSNSYRMQHIVKRG
ncbi:MAG: 4Fe-4S binding protein [Gammaproteobacteria bacterium]|nr:4Fe-4S binding protein [Gammaproteobacteria bacterium]